LLGEHVEVLVVVGHEVLPVDDLEDLLVGRGCPPDEDRRRGERRAHGKRPLEELATAEAPERCGLLCHVLSLATIRFEHAPPDRTTRGGYCRFAAAATGARRPVGGRPSR